MTSPVTIFARVIRQAHDADASNHTGYDHPTIFTGNLARHTTFTQLQAVHSCR